MSCTPNKKYIRRRRGACDSCKQRKVRCDGENPCTACHRSGLTCHYQPSAIRPKKDIFISIDTDITNCQTPPPLYLDTNSPAYDPNCDYSAFTPVDSCRSATYWNSEFSPISAISPDVECFQALDLCPDSSGQTTWVYPGDQVNEPYMPELFDYKCPLPKADRYEEYVPNDSTVHETFQCFVPSQDRLFQDHVLCSNDYIQDLKPIQPQYTEPAFSTKVPFSDLRFMNNENLAGYHGLPEFYNETQTQ